jgi:hypothetical protein
MTTLSNRNSLVTEKEAAALIGMSVRTLQQRRYLRMPPRYIRLPGSRSIRYRLPDLTEFIENGIIDWQENS